MTDTGRAEPTPAELIRGQVTGSLIGAVFGLIYLEVNAGPLPGPVALPLRIAGFAAFAVVVAALVRGQRRSAQAPAAATAPRSGHNVMFGRGYWLVVLGEAVALFAGLALLNGPLHTPNAGVAWVSFVVGVHFLPLAALFRVQLFVWLGGAITACGIAGLALAAAGTSEAPIAVSSGLVPGALLLAWAWHGARTLPDLSPGA